MSGAYVTWMELGGLGYRSYIQHLTSGGTPAVGWPADGVPVASTPGDQYEPAIVSDGGVGAIVAWGDSRAPYPASFDVYAQQFEPAGVVATLASLASAEATPEEVRLRWQVSGAARANVERREGTDGWQELATLDADGGGYMSHTDRAVSPGRAYSYRLAFASGVRAGEVRVSVPARLAFELEGARPNPAEGAVSLAFTLPDAAPARLELYDISGRLIAAREVGALGAGRHQLRLADTPVRPGLYWAALTHRGRSLRCRVAVVR